MKNGYKIAAKKRWSETNLFHKRTRRLSGYKGINAFFL